MQYLFYLCVIVRVCVSYLSQSRQILLSDPRKIATKDIYLYAHSKGMWHKAVFKVWVPRVKETRNKNFSSSRGISILRTFHMLTKNPTPSLGPCITERMASCDWSTFYVILTADCIRKDLILNILDKSDPKQPCLADQ